MHWASEYIGIPYVLGARGPDAFDCLGLVLHVQAHHYGRNIDLQVDGYNDARIARHLLRTHPERLNWRETASPVDGGIVLMSTSGVPYHIGVTIEANNTIGVLHCVEGASTVFQPVRNLTKSGWGRFAYYECAK